MKINLIAIGKRLPAWVNMGFHTYANRLPRDFALSLLEIPAIKRTKSTNLAKIAAQESQMLLDALPKNSEIVILDRRGEEIDTPTLAEKLSQWRNENHHLSLLIGSPEGLSPSCLEKAHWIWSLSRLTFPHPLARIVVAEQIYRAWSIMANHPYHR